MFENVLDVLDHKFSGCLRCVPTTVRAEEAGRKVDANNAAGFTDCSQLLVSEISRMGAQSVRVRMRGDERRVADGGNVPEPAFIQVRQIDQNPQPVAGANQLLAEVRQTGSGVGR
jgi:hypothetical protein